MMAEMMNGEREELLDMTQVFEEDTQKDQYLTFVCEGESLAVEIRYVGEIIGVPLITELPGMEDYVKGLINLRGQMIPMMDMRLRLAKPAVPYTDKTCTIVIYYEAYTVGLIVDAVSDVVCIPPESMIEFPAAREGDHYQFMRGLGKPRSAADEQETRTDENQMVFIVELEELLRHEKGEKDDR